MQFLPGMMVYLAYKAAASVQAKVYRDKKGSPIDTQERIFYFKENSGKD